MTSSEGLPSNPNVQYKLEVIANGQQVVGETIAGPMSLRTIASYLRSAAEKVEDQAFEDLRNHRSA
jgi:hypothetical protein